MYSNGLSEVMLGKSIKALNVERADVVILTKVHMPVKAGKVGGKRPPATAADLDAAGYANQRGLSRKHIFDSVQDSLKRLDTDYIDVLQCHRKHEAGLLLSNVGNQASLRCALTACCSFPTCL